LKKRIELLKLEKKEAEAKRTFNELQKVYDPRADLGTEEEVSHFSKELEEESLRLDCLIKKKQAERTKSVLESEVQFYEKALKRKVA
jgi:hypothetical protein